MRHEQLVALCFVVGTWLAAPAVAHACSCNSPLPSSPASARAFDVVFAGTMTRLERPEAWLRVNPDGSVELGFGEGPSRATFDVHRVYRGRDAREVVLTLDRSCDPPFKVGQEWLVYALEREGIVATSVCSRTRLREEAASDVEYLDGAARGVPQGVLYGAAHQRIIDASGQPQLRVLFESLQVVAAASDGRRFVTPTDSKSTYQLVLPPGNFEIWVERAGQRVSEVDKVSVTADMDQHLMVSASF